MPAESARSPRSTGYGPRLDSHRANPLRQISRCIPGWTQPADLRGRYQLRTLVAEDRTDERRSCTHPSDTAPGRRPWSAWGLVAGFPRFFPVRIDDLHHTPYNEEI